MMAGPHRRWRPDEEAFVRAAIAYMTVPTIAARLGRTPKAVLRWMERHRVYPTRTGDYVTSGVASRLTGLTPQELTALARERRIRARRVPGGRWWMFDTEDLPMDEFARLAEARISRHAVQRFRQRIDRGAPESRITAMIREGLRRPVSVTRRDLRDGTPSLTVLANVETDERTYTFRLVIVPSRFPGQPPVVGTVLHGTEGRSRGRNHYSKLRARGVPRSREAA